MLLNWRKRSTGSKRKSQNVSVLGTTARITFELDLKYFDIPDKNISDIAMSQTADMTHRQAADVKEKNILRAAVRELQMEGQDKLVIGKLHQHILSLQISETAALKKLEDVSAKCSKLESTILQVCDAEPGSKNYRLG